MYTEYWQLATKPFEPTFDESFLFSCPAQQAALHKLRYTVEGRRSAAVVAGPAGCGKSVLIQSLRSQLGDDIGKFVQLVFPLMSSRDLLAYLAEEIGAPPADPPLRTIEESLRRLEFALDEQSRRGKHTVMVIEEAHLLEDSGLMETLRLLTNLQPAGQPALTLILVGQPSLLSSLRRNPTFEQRLDLKTLLKPLNKEETADYVNHRLHAAGATRPLFSADALDVLHRLSGGLPRQINRLGDLALVVGFAAEQHTIDAEQIEAVHGELVNLAAAA